MSKRKKKRKAEGLQGAPFYLKDGDVIGVKVNGNKNSFILVIVGEAIETV